MNISDRIQNLRKVKGITQEELADKAGVSRQAVSKWESGQSLPDLDKVVVMSEYFGVTTDYILKGIENPKQEEKKTDANISVIAATVLNFIGLVLSCAVWYEQQTATALMIGLVLMAIGCMIFGMGMVTCSEESRLKGKYNFWQLNIWLLSFIPLSCLHNLLVGGTAAPYPLPASPLFAFPVFWVVYLAIGIAVDLTVIKKKKNI